MKLFILISIVSLFNFVKSEWNPIEKADETDAQLMVFMRDKFNNIKLSDTQMNRIEKLMNRFSNKEKRGQLKKGQVEREEFKEEMLRASGLASAPITEFNLKQITNLEEASLGGMTDKAWNNWTRLIKTATQCVTEGSERDCDKLREKIKKLKEMRKKNKNTAKRPILKAIIKKMVLKMWQNRKIQSGLMLLKDVFGTNSTTIQATQKSGPIKLQQTMQKQSTLKTAEPQKITINLQANGGKAN